MVYLWDQCESDSTTLARPVSLLALTRLTFYLLLHLDPSVGPNNDPSHDNLSRRLFAFIIAPLYSVTRAKREAPFLWGRAGILHLLQVQL